MTEVEGLLARMLGDQWAERNGYAVTYSARHVDAAKLLVDVARTNRELVAEAKALRSELASFWDEMSRRLGTLDDLVRDTRAAVNRKAS